MTRVTAIEYGWTSALRKNIAPKPSIAMPAPDRAPDSTMYQLAMTGVAPHLSCSRKIIAAEIAGPPGKVADQAFADSPRALAVVRMTFTPADRSRTTITSAWAIMASAIATHAATTYQLFACLMASQPSAKRW